MEFRPWRTQLTAEESAVVGACLRAAADGPFFPDWEFSTIFGFERDEIREVANSWPASPDEHREFRAINSSMNNLLGYPHGLDSVWTEWIPADRSAVDALFERIREASGASDATRAFLSAEMARLVKMTDEELQANSRLIADVVRSAERLGVAVPTRLVTQ